MGQDYRSGLFCFYYFPPVGPSGWENVYCKPMTALRAPNDNRSLTLARD